MRQKTKRARPTQRQLKARQQPPNPAAVTHISTQSVAPAAPLSDDPEEQHRVAERTFWQGQLHISKWLNWITLSAALIALGGLYFVAMSLKEARVATIEANRAWIAVKTAGFIGKPEKVGDQFALAVPYSNIGREPALAARKFQESFWIDGLNSPTEVMSAGALNIPINGTCSKVDFATGIGAIWPLAGDEKPSTARDGEAIRTVTDDLVRKRRLLGYHGCFIYETFGSTHRTGFCFFLAPAVDAPISQWVWSVCPGPNQNFAD